MDADAFQIERRLFSLFPTNRCAVANNASTRKSAFISVHPRFVLNSQQDLSAVVPRCSRTNQHPASLAGGVPRRTAKSRRRGQVHVFGQRFSQVAESCSPKNGPDPRLCSSPGGVPAPLVLSAVVWSDDPKRVLHTAMWSRHDCDQPSCF